MVTGSERVCPILEFDKKVIHSKQLARTHLELLISRTALGVGKDQRQISNVSCKHTHRKIQAYRHLETLISLAQP